MRVGIAGAQRNVLWRHSVLWWSGGDGVEATLCVSIGVIDRGCGDRTERPRASRQLWPCCPRGAACSCRMQLRRRDCVSNAGAGGMCVGCVGARVWWPPQRPVPRVLAVDATGAAGTPAVFLAACAVLCAAAPLLLRCGKFECDCMERQGACAAAAHPHDRAQRAARAFVGDMLHAKAARQCMSTALSVDESGSGSGIHAWGFIGRGG
eukprot:jgi/Ulvmu1/325/UM001_0329.1